MVYHDPLEDRKEKGTSGSNPSIDGVRSDPEVTVHSLHQEELMNEYSEWL